ncbi:MAG: hypothetical protein KDC87_16945 [Planctomycetes bacterium]|nr:hypothetical protein [Planctomycetota bacterium]MCB9872190.1 hypothetical protein [Planctomycetota bacterium]
MDGSQTDAVTVVGKALRRRSPLFEAFQLELPAEVQPSGIWATTLREVISWIVRADVAAFRRGRRSTLLAQSLALHEATVGAGPQAADEPDWQPRTVDTQAVLDTVLREFRERAFLVVVDGHEHARLDARVSLRPDSKITFLRLTLASGW